MKLIELVTSHPKALSQEGLRLLCQDIEIRQSAYSQRGGNGEGGDDVLHGVCSFGLIDCKGISCTCQRFIELLQVFKRGHGAVEFFVHGLCGVFIERFKHRRARGAVDNDP